MSFGGKVKTEHSIIQGLMPLLQQLAAVAGVKSVVPGRIMRRGKAQPQATVTLTVRTATGWKAQGKSKGSVQELFIVTAEPEAVAQALAALWLSG